MKVIVVTGGIASGKSTVVEMLTEIGGKGVEVFDCDKAVEDYLAGNLEFISNISCNHHDHPHGEGHVCGGNHSCIGR